MQNFFILSSSMDKTVRYRSVLRDVGKGKVERGERHGSKGRIASSNTTTVYFMT